MNFIEWLLTTIQYRSFRAYKLIKDDQKRRKDEGEPPFDGSWYLKLKSRIWALRHKHKTDYFPSEIIAFYDRAIEELYLKLEGLPTDTLKSPLFTVRLSGSTIVVNEMWAINRSASGIYVHRRQEMNEPWILVYRSYWLMANVKFIEMLDVISRSTCLHQPFFPIEQHNKENALIN